MATPETPGSQLAQVPTTGSAPAPESAPIQSPETQAPAPVSAEPAAPSAPAPEVTAPVVDPISKENDISLSREIQAHLDGQYMRSLESRERSQAAAVRTSVAAVKGDDPARAQKAAQLAQKMNLPVGVVLRNYDSLAKDERVQGHDFDSMVQKFPSTSLFLEDPDQARVVVDQIGSLQKVEKQAQNASTLTKTMGYLKSGIYGLGANVARVPGTLAQMALMDAAERDFLGGMNPLYASPSDYTEAALSGRGKEVRLPNGLTYRAPDVKSVPPDWINNPLARELDRKAEAQAALYPELSTDILQAIQDGDFESATAGLTAQIIANAPQSIGILAATASGFGAPALVATGTISGAGATGEAVDAGVAPEQAVAYGVASGVAEAAFESIPVNLFKRWEGVISRSYGKESSRRIFGDFFKTIVSSAVGEGSEEAATSIAQDLAGYLTGVKTDLTFEEAIRNAINSGFVGAGSGAIITGPSAITAGMARAQRLRMQNMQSGEAMNSKNAYLKMGESFAEASSLAEGVPAMGEKFMQDVANRNGIPNVYIPTQTFETYFQSKGQSPEQLALELGVDLNEAKQTGMPLEIPYGKWTASFGKTTTYAELQDDIKFSPDALTVNESRAEREGLSQEIAAEDAAIQEMANKEPSTEISPEDEQKQIRQVVKDFEGQLRESDLNPRQAEALRGLAVLALREGIAPADLMAELNVRIRRGEQAVPAGAGTFNQDAINAPAFYSKLERTVTEKMGNSASVEQINGMLREIKPEERKWSGLDQFLAGKEKVSKAELQDFLRANALQIQEITKGGDGLEALSIQRAQAQSEYEESSRARKVARDFLVDKVFQASKNTSEALGIATQVKQYSEDPEAINDIAEQHGATEEALAYAQALNTEAEFKQRVEELDSARRATTTTQYERFQLPGGENYREVLFTLPVVEPTPITELPEGFEIVETTEGLRFGDDSPDRVRYKIVDADGFSPRGLFDTREEAIAAAIRAENREASRLVNEQNNYRSSHFQEANVLAHTRLNDRVDADGKRVLFVEEIQSDWHQDGRKKGYGPQTETKVEAYYDTPSGPVTIGYGATEAEALASSDPNWKNIVEVKYRTQENVVGAGVPDAPFRKTWHEFVMKRLIREAAEKGYDKVAWTTGEQQADRYDLAKQVDAVKAKKNKDGTYAIQVVKGGQTIEDVPSVKESDLESQLGKDLAAKIVEGSTGRMKTYKGVDLKVGGEGMKGFYDKILVDFANKFGKKYGAKVEASNVVTPTTQEIEARNAEALANRPDPSPDGALSFVRLERPNEYSDVGSIKVHSLEITPELKAAALGEGFTLFQGGEDGPLGQIQIAPDGSSINIDIFKNADLSTLIHESGHLYLEVVRRLSTRDGASEQIKTDAKTIADWVGAESLGSLTVEQHEQFARGFEAYLMEGKAPSKGLAKAFARFKAWLVRTYQNLSSLNVQLSPEIRDVFDRIIATENEIGRAQIKSGYVPFGRDVGLTTSEAERLETARAEASAEAEAKLAAKLVGDAQREQTAEYKARESEVRTQVENYLNETQVYKAIAILQQNKTPDGMNVTQVLPNAVMKIDRSMVPENLADAISRKHGQRVFSKSRGQDPGVLAPILGFNNAADMIDTLAGVPSYQDEVQRRVDERMQAEFPDILKSPDVLEQQAMEDVHNENQARLYKMELDILAEKHKASLKSAIRAVARRAPTSQAVQAEAEGFVSKKLVRDLKPQQYVRAEQKANIEAGKLLAKGDIAGAFDAKKRALLNYEMYRAATTAQKAVQKNLDGFKKMYRKDEDLAKSRDLDLVNGARAILGGYGLGRRTAQAPIQYLENLKKYGVDKVEGEQLFNGVMGLVTPALEGATNYKDVSYQKFSEMADAVNAIWELSRDLRTVEIDGRRKDIAQVKEEIYQEIDAGIVLNQAPAITRDKTKYDGMKSTLLGFKAALTRVEGWFRAVDDGRGALTKNMYEPVADGILKFREAKSGKVKELAALFTKNKGIFTQQEIQAPELGHVFSSKSTLIGALMHIGNESNKSKLLRGRNWGDVNEDGTLDTSRWDSFFSRMIAEGQITKADMDFVQGVWDLYESVKPDAQRAHRKIFGFHFAEITATPVQTPFGTYRGGYAPAKVDVNEDVAAEIRAERQAFEEGNASWVFPTTGSGFAKNRVEAYAAPLSLDLRLAERHLDWVLRFTHIEPAVRDVAKMTLDPNFRAKIATIDPNIMKNAITPWLKRSASQSVVTPSTDGTGKVLDQFATYTRATAAAGLMFANVVNTLEQFTGIVVAASQVSPRFLMNTLGSYIANPKATAAAVAQRSAFMNALQDETIDKARRGIKKIVDPSWKVVEKIEAFQSHTYVMQIATQNIVNTVVWTASYNESLSKGMSELDAVREADSAVRRTQGSQNPEDVSDFETGSPTARLFKMFTGYFNMVANLNASEILRIQRTLGMKKGTGRMFYVYLMSSAVPAILSTLLRKVAGGSLDSDDDDEYVDDVLEATFVGPGQALIATVPFFGQITNAAINRFNDNFYDDRMSLSPVFSILEGAIGGVKSTVDLFDSDETTKKQDIKDILTLIGLATKSPIGALGRQAGYLYNVATGEAEPENAADFLRGVVTGRD